MSKQSDLSIPQDVLADAIVGTRRIVEGQPSLADQLATANQVPVFYWRTDCGNRRLPKMGTTVTETSAFIIVEDNATQEEVALFKSDYQISTELTCVYDTVAGFIEYHETENCTVEFADEQANELKDFLKLVLKNTIK